MQSTPKTIQIFLPGGDPQGIRPSQLSAPYLEEEMSMLELDALPKAEKQSMSVHSQPAWSLDSL